MADIRIVERDGDTIWIEAQGHFGTIEVITTIQREGDTLVLSGLGITGQGPGSTGISVLRELARQFGREQGAKRIQIEGGRRLTGAKPGHIPRPIVIEVE
jgi:hypothetical protein